MGCLYGGVLFHLENLCESDQLFGSELAEPRSVRPRSKFLTDLSSEALSVKKLNTQEGAKLPPASSWINPVRTRRISMLQRVALRVADALRRGLSGEASRSPHQPLRTAEEAASTTPSNVVVMTHMRLADWHLPNNDYAKERIARLERELEAA